MQIRTQLVLAFALSAAASVLILLMLGTVVVAMMAQRAAVNVVEREVALLANAAAGVAEWSLASSNVTGPLGPALPLSVRRTVDCGGAEPLPPWLGAGKFHGVIADGARISVRAVAQGTEGRCRAWAVADLPLGEETAALLAAASELRVEVPGPPPGRRRDGAGPPDGKRGRMQTPPDPVWLIVRRIPGLGGGRAADWTPVVATARDWQTGGPIDKVLFRVQPDFAVVFRQVSQYGQRSAAWIWLLPLLGLAFAAVEAVAFRAVLRTIRRIAGGVETLGEGVRRIGAGDLAHRVQVERPRELAVLASGVNAMAASLERLLEETSARAHLEEEIRLARQAQLSLYPRALPEPPGVSLAALCEPAQMVSGDLYDALELAPGRIGLLCADVSGKGMAAALLMSNVQAMARAALRAEPPAPCRLAADINRDLCERIPANRFVTLFWGEYDAAARLLRYTNAGHCPPLLFQPGEDAPRRLETGGLPVGLFARASFAQAEEILRPGALLVVYTDGVTEAPDAAGEEFGEERLVELCRAHRHAAAAEVAAAIVRAADAWTTADARADDTTVLVMRVEA